MNLTIMKKNVCQKIRKQILLLMRLQIVKIKQKIEEVELVMDIIFLDGILYYK